MGELLQLHIELKGIKPSIWRSVCVPDWITLKQLHQVLQIAFGWQDCHLYEFDILGRRYIDYDDEYSVDTPPAKASKARLGLCLLGKKSFTYVYDFGDYWVHKITVKKSIPMIDGDASPFCLDGKRACPPEDVGGVGGYEDMLVALSDPEHEEHDSINAWLGGQFLPDVFDQALVDRQLFKLKFKQPSARTLAAAQLKSWDFE
jgi:Plasmid pRiA4b ORF-3-like protein